jgi:hypothetical protein
MKRTLLSVLILIFAAVFAACATAQIRPGYPGWIKQEGETPSGIP